MSSTAPAKSQCAACRVRICGQSGPFCLRCGAKNLNRARMARGEVRTCPYCKGTKKVTWGSHGAGAYCEDTP